MNLTVDISTKMQSQVILDYFTEKASQEKQVLENTDLVCSFLHLTKP